jgi:hypothetical protein
MTITEFKKILEQTGQLHCAGAWQLWYEERYGPLQPDPEDKTDAVAEQD